MNTPTRFRKKPVVIEAMQFDGTVESANRVLGWIGTNGGTAYRRHPNMISQGIAVETLEGDMGASPGDWIIRGVQGEFYPCKSDIFEATYERVDDDERTDSVSEVRGDEAP